MVINTKQMPDIKKTVPIEDIGFVVLEHQQTSITLPLLNALSDNNVAVIFCGENRMPNSMLMNLDSNTTQGESFRAQIDASEPCLMQQQNKTQRLLYSIVRHPVVV